MPREGTKTQVRGYYRYLTHIEIRYAPGGDENYQKKNAVLSDEEKN